MDRLRDRKDMHGGQAQSASPSLRHQPVQGTPAGPILAAKRRRHLHPFFYRIGPGTLSVCSVLLIGLMAILYLSQLGQAVTANQQIQDLHQRQATLQRENQDLVNTIAQEESPAYIIAHARAMGLVPANPKAVQILVVKYLRTIPRDDQDLQP
jgi:cell division protein FtsB